MSATPGAGQKMRAPHIVPLSQQNIDFLEQIREISGGLELVFPNIRDPYKPMSENTINKALRLIEYDTKRMSAATDSGQWPIAPW